MSVVAKALKYEKNGEPKDVLKLVEEKLDAPQGNQVLVKMLAAPINPSDALAIRGIYPVKLKFPATAGFEGVGEVVSVGADVKTLAPGQRVVPTLAIGKGTWTTYAIFNEDELIPVSSKISLVEAATILVNPCTAYRMVKDIGNLKAGDCIIQNGANSAVGQAVHQLCKLWGIQSVGIVRDRPNIAELKAYLKKLGATEVLTEEELSTTKIFADKTVNRPRIAYDCIGGKSAVELLRHLAERGNLVVYGSMTSEPVTATGFDLIFKDITISGFWLGRWFKENPGSGPAKQMFKELSELMESKKLLEPLHEIIPLENFKVEAADALSLKGFAGKKILFSMH